MWQKTRKSNNRKRYPASTAIEATDGFLKRERERRESHDLGARPAVPCSTTFSSRLFQGSGQEMHERHPAPCKEDVARMKLFPVALVSLAPLPSIPLMQEACFFSLAPDRQVDRRDFAQCRKLNSMSWCLNVCVSPCVVIVT